MLLNGFFPEQSDIVTLQRMQNFKERISLTDEELDSWKITTVNGTFRQEVDAAPVEFEVGEVLHGKITEILKAMNAESRLTVAHISLYEKFVERTAPASNGVVTA